MKYGIFPAVYIRKKSKIRVFFRRYSLNLHFQYQSIIINSNQMAEIKDTNNQLDETQNIENQNSKGYNFVEQLVYDDLKAGKNGGRLNTRFPPEPNGYLHIGHAKAICMDFGVAEKFGGTCNLRFDDTNPVKEDVEYVDSIREDIKWLGFDWGNRE